MAQQLQSQGRGEDSMLVHMTPGEVNSLQGLAMAHGGSLTINPETGLPEAGFLKKLLPTLLGVGLNFIPGVGPLAAAGLVAAGSVAKTGSLKKGLMAGLQAYGGASLAGGLAPTATGTVSKTASTATNALTKVAPTRDAVSIGNTIGGPAGLKIPAFAPGASGTGLTTAVNTAGQAAGQAAGGSAGVLQQAVVHRLDKATSGLLVLAKTKAANQHLQRQFATGSTERKYIARVWGCPEPKNGSINLPLGRDPEQPQLIRVDSEGHFGKPALTHYHWLENQGETSLLALFPQTGRTHQLRIHLHHIGHGIVGDQLPAVDGDAPWG
jgi:hypothetical protein